MEGMEAGHPLARVRVANLDVLRSDVAVLLCEDNDDDGNAVSGGKR